MQNEDKINEQLIDIARKKKDRKKNLKKNRHSNPKLTHETSVKSAVGAKTNSRAVTRLAKIDGRNQCKQLRV